ncbi:MAG: VOC family protein [Candidatus Cloacimonadota bacterium]|nr:MAG: VOC family protein [Candidatus Cloacimonadota bacterium]
MHGICHIEIPTTDANKSKEFYGRIFGWEFEDGLGGEYVTFKPPEGVGGGFDKERKPCTDGVAIYIEVEDIESKLTEIEGAGGKKLVPKTKISDEYGYYAMFLDPVGNSVGLWSKK